MDTKSALSIAGKHLQALKGHTFDLLTVTKPISPSASVNLAKIISKLSPLLGNLIEFNSVEILNDRSDFKGHGAWRRQDPGFLSSPRARRRSLAALFRCKNHVRQIYKNTIVYASVFFRLFSEGDRRVADHDD
jgi:hypothetical protein